LIISSKTKTSRWRRVVRIFLTTLAVACVFLLVLLHGLAALFSLHDRNMRPYASHVLTDSSGHTIHYYELRQTNAEWNIVFIHGTPATAAVFGEQFRNPFPHANLFALDRPGFGGSRPSARKPSLDDQADAVGALLAQLPKARTIVVGHSYGGPVAVEAGLKFPNQIAGLLLIGGSVDPAQEHIYAVQRIADWPIVSWLGPHLLRQCNRELLTLRGDLLQLQPELPRLSIPVVMLHGTKDRQVPVANVDYLRGQLAMAGKSNLFDALVITNYNHFIPWEHPDAVEQALERLTNHISASEVH
jgi:pimeloyl-ACP methyl ester carboxylesterase